MGMDQINQQLSDFSAFVGGKLKNYPSLSIGEKISYPAIGLGFILFLTSVVLFIL